MNNCSGYEWIVGSEKISEKYRFWKRLWSEKFGSEVVTGVESEYDRFVEKMLEIIRDYEGL